MLVFEILLLTLFINSIKCNVNVQLINPVYREFSKTDFNITRMFGSSSPYTILEQCKPFSVWMLLRHGSKFPSEQIIENIDKHLVKNILPRLRELYGDSNHKNFTKLKKNQQKYIVGLLKWKNALNEASHKDLNKPGKTSMLDLGKRLNEKLKPLTSTLKKDEIEVLSAKEDRCVISARKFLRTFFEGDHDEIIIQIASNEDQRLEINKPREEDIQVEHPTQRGIKMAVEDLYLKLHCGKVTNKIKLILFPNHIEKYDKLRDKLNDEIVKTMYDACAHGYYHKDTSENVTDAWCQLFDFDDLEMFENMYDLQYYNNNGYHLETNRMLGNALTDDLQLFLKEPKRIKFKLFVAHTSNVLSLITRFNLFKDEQKLTIENIQKMKHRQWRSSYMVPYGCNIIVVVYDCGFVNFRVSIYLNETPIEMIIHRNDGDFKCVKCPLDDIIHLIDTFETSKRPPLSISLGEREAKQHKKEKKMREKKEALENEIIKEIRKKLDERKREMYDEDETYTDEIKGP